MKDSFRQLQAMVYSGRGITIGMTPAGNAFIGYTLTGRSPPSQARELVQSESGVIRTQPIVEDAGGSAALLFYPAIVPVTNDMLIASNGSQTNLIFSEAINYFNDDGSLNSDMLNHGSILDGKGPEKILRQAMKESTFLYDSQQDRWIDLTASEPDAPNNTPRISGCLIPPEAALCINTKSRSIRFGNTFNIALSPGKAYSIMTYAGGNESPLRPFEGSPLEAAAICSETSQDIAESLYEAIHGGSHPGENYRVAAAVMMQKPEGLETAIINRSERGD